MRIQIVFPCLLLLSACASVPLNPVTPTTQPSSSSSPSVNPEPSQQFVRPLDGYVPTKSYQQALNAQLLNESKRYGSQLDCNSEAFDAHFTISPENDANRDKPTPVLFNEGCALAVSRQTGAYQYEAEIISAKQSGETLIVELYEKETFHEDNMLNDYIRIKTSLAGIAPKLNPDQIKSIQIVLLASRPNPQATPSPQPTPSPNPVPSPLP